MSERLYMPHAGHFIGGNSCAFKLNTYVNGYIVSTVGEYRPSFSRVDLNARVKGQIIEGFEELGYSGDPSRPALYETMVFRAVKADDKCCPWRQESGEEIDSRRYSTGADAHEGHEEFVKKYEAPQ